MSLFAFDAPGSGPPRERIALAQDRLTCLPDPLALVESMRGDGLPWLLESALVDGRLGRHTLLGADPFAVLTARGDTLALEVRRACRPGWSPGRQIARGDAFEAVRALWPRTAADALPGRAELPFVGGAVAVFGYELAERIESLGLDQAADLDTPDLTLLLVDRLVSIDHETGEAVALALGFGRTDDEAAQAADDALRDWMRVVEAGLSAWRDVPAGRAASRSPQPRSGDDAPDTGPGRDAYAERVRRILEEIERGGVYEVNLTQRMSAPWQGDPLALYAAKGAGLSRRSAA